MKDTMILKDGTRFNRFIVECEANQMQMELMALHRV